MKIAIVFAAFVAVACAGTIVQDQDVSVLRYDNTNDGNNQYQWNVETSDGQTRSETGHLNNIGTEQEALQVTGTYQYTGPDGKLYTLSYVADENGFQPQGAHLPVPV